MKTINVDSIRPLKNYLINMQITVDTAVGEIVRSNFKTAQVFENYGIDFCCGGGKSLKEVSLEKGVDINKLIPEIHSALELGDADARYFESLSPGDLCDYIINRHHTYVNDNIPFLTLKLQKLSDKHGSRHPELNLIKELFEDAACNLTLHMKKEELVLFPYIKRIAKAASENAEVKTSASGSLRSQIEELNKEHDTEGLRFEKISRISANYSVPPDGCTTFDVTYKTLAEFEKDLHKHIHLENNILFKKALDIESGLMLN